MLKSIQRLFPLERLFPMLAYNAQYEEEIQRENLSLQEWQAMGLTYIFMLGLCLVAAGIIFFFAYNWQDIPAFVKLGMIQIGFVVSVFSAYKLQLDTVLGKIALLFASLLIGVFLAVFGQIYQTGADAYTLFMVWAIAILPFAVISRFSAQWIMLLILSNLSIYLWLIEFLRHIDNIENIIFTIIILFNALLLTLRECFSKKFTWLNSFITRRIIFAILQTAITLELCFSIFDDVPLLYNPVSLLSIALSVILFLVYRYVFKDIFVIVNTLLASVGVFILFFASHLNFSFEEVLLLAVCTITIYIALAIYLEVLYKKFKHEQENISTTQPKAKKTFSAILKKIVLSFLLGSLYKPREQKEEEFVFEEKNTVSDEENSITTQDDTSKKQHLTPTSKENISHNAPPIMKIFTAVSAFISVCVCTALAFLFYDGFFRSEYFFLIFGILALIASLAIHILISKNTSSFFMLYLGVTLLLQGYIFIAFALLEEFNTPLYVAAFIFAILSNILYPFLKYAGSRILISLITLAFISSSVYDDNVLLLLMLAIMLIILTFALQLEKKVPALAPFIRALYISFSIKTMSLLVGFLSFEKAAISFYSLFSIILSIWVAILYFLYAKKTHTNIDIKNIYKNKPLLFAFSLLCFAILVYFEAYALLYIAGMLLLALYFEKIELLRESIYFSMLIIPLYYYNLDINLLAKSMLLFLSGTALLTFSALNKEVFKHA